MRLIFNMDLFDTALARETVKPAERSGRVLGTMGKKPQWLVGRVYPDNLTVSDFWDVSMPRVAKQVHENRRWRQVRRFDISLSFAAKIRLRTEMAIPLPFCITAFLCLYFATQQ